MTKKEKENINEVAEYGLDSRYESKKERDSEAILLMEDRLNRMKNLSKDQIIQAKLMQLKLKMEAYIKQAHFDNRNHFSEFLAFYIDIIYAKRNIFADDINITPVKLSQVINNHREPTEELILKLMVHSEKLYSKIGGFQKEIWYLVYFHEKICETMSTQQEWRPKIEKLVKFSESIEVN